jgi:hypothetical protein
MAEDASILPPPAANGKWPQKPAGARRPQIEHFPNAFDAVGKWEFFS